MNWSGDEKRRFVRANFPCRILLRTPHEHKIDTYTENLGAGGVRVIIQEALALADEVALELYLHGEKAPIVCTGRVVWVVNKESVCHRGVVFYDTGLEFVEINDVSRDTIRQLIDGIVKGRK